MSAGKSVRLFLADGTPGGVMTAEIMNWTGHVVAGSRTDLGLLLKRPEVRRTGVYILLGDDPESLGGTLAYIGESDNISNRVYEHSLAENRGGKDFWDRAVLLTSKDANLTKAHARYLESRLITIARTAKRARLVNGTAPAPLPLPESDQSDMEYFINQAEILLPVLGVNLLRSSKSRPLPAVGESVGTSLADESPLFELTSPKHGYAAKAREIDGEFTVLEGSTARSSWFGVYDGYQNLRKKLEQDGTIDVSSADALGIFTRDCVFASSSAAAACVTGRAANGREEWKVSETAMSYGQWQNEEIERELQRKDQ